MASALALTMATTIAYQGLGPAAATVEAPLHPPRRGVLLSLSQTLCGWRKSGHEMILKTEGKRLYLQCRLCFRETPGWSIERSHVETTAH